MAFKPLTNPGAGANAADYWSKVADDAGYGDAARSDARSYANQERAMAGTGSAGVTLRRIDSWNSMYGQPQAPAAEQPLPPGGGQPAPTGPMLPSPVPPQQTTSTPAKVPQIPLGSTNRQQTPGTIGAFPGSTSAPGPDGTTRHTSVGLQAEPQPGTPQPQGDPMQAQLRTAIMGLLGTNVNEASVTDADVAPQSRAYEAAVQRAAQQQRAEVMEQANVEGTIGAGATKASLGGIGMEAGQMIGEKNADLIGQKLDARRQQLQQAMQVASQMGMAQEANDLQRQIANLDAQMKGMGIDVTREGYQLQRDLGTLDTQTKTYLADLDAKLQREGYGLQERLGLLDAEIRKLGINTQGNLGQLELALKRELGIGGLNLDYLGLMMQDRQQGNRLGFDIGALQAQLNRDALLAGLGGGG